MMNLLKMLDGVPWSLAIILCLTIGLAPYRPPHVWEKLIMLLHGQLRRPLDIFDFLLHGAPWIILLIKVILIPWRTK